MNRHFHLEVSSKIISRRILFILVCTWVQLDAIVFNCNYFFEDAVMNKNTNVVIKNAYTCLVRVSKTCHEDESFLVGVDNNHWPDQKKIMSKLDVAMLRFEYQQITTLPKNIHEFYPHLRAFFLMHSPVTEISKAQLLFPDLKVLYISYTSITFLRSDVFVHLSRLELLGLEHNMITSVGLDVLLPLEQLKHAYLTSNPCTSNKSVFNQKKIDKKKFDQIRNELEKSCMANEQTMQPDVVPVDPPFEMKLRKDLCGEMYEYRPGVKLVDLNEMETSTKAMKITEKPTEALIDISGENTIDDFTTDPENKDAATKYNISEASEKVQLFTEPTTTPELEEIQSLEAIQTSVQETRASELTTSTIFSSTSMPQIGTEAPTTTKTEKSTTILPKTTYRVESTSKMLQTSSLPTTKTEPKTSSTKVLTSSTKKLLQVKQKITNEKTSPKIKINVTTTTTQPMKPKTTTRTFPAVTENTSDKKPIENTSIVPTKFKATTPSITSLWQGNWGDAFNDEDDLNAATVDHDNFNQ